MRVHHRKPRPDVLRFVVTALLSAVVVFGLGSMLCVAEHARAIIDGTDVASYSGASVAAACAAVALTPKARLLARYRDEKAGPPNGTEVPVRCTDHGRFILWVSPPAPPCRVACPESCSDLRSRSNPDVQDTDGLGVIPR